MNITDTAIIRTPAHLVKNAVDALPSDVPDFALPDIALPDIDMPDFGNVAEAVGDTLIDVGETLVDVVSAVAVTGSKGATRVLRTVRRHPKGAGIALVVVFAAVFGAVWYKRRSVRADPHLHIADAA